MNFSFLNPIFLIGIAAVALPVIAHLISRKSGFKKRFPAVRFLLASQGEMATRSRLKDLLLLLLRALIIVLIALLFAKPSLFSFSSAPVSEPRALAVVVDNSFSMGYRDNFNLAINEAENILNASSDGSFFAVLPLVPKSGEVISVTQDRSAAKKELGQISLSETFTENEKRLEKIYSSLDNAPNEEKAVVFITDFQKNGWRNEEFERSWLTLVDVSSEEPPENMAVTQVNSRSSRDSVTISSRVANFRENEENELLVSAELYGQEIKTYVDIPPGSFTAEEFVFNSSGETEPLESTGSVWIPKDLLPIDDTRRFVVSGSDSLQVLIVDGDPREDLRLSESYYLASAAETASELLNARIRIIDNERFLDEELSGHEIVFLVNVGEITPRIAGELRAFTQRGGTLVIFPGDRVRAGSYNTLFKDMLPGELGPPLDINSGVLSSGTEPFSEDLFQNLTQANVKRAFSLIPREEAETILSLDTNEPYLAYKNLGQGKTFLFTSTADNAWSNFAITPVFAPMIKELLDIESLSNTKRRNYIVGEKVNITRPEPESTVEITAPSGERYEFDEGESVFTRSDISGIYEVWIDGEKSYEFAVNVDPLESNLEKISTASIEPDLGEEIGLVKVFRELWRYFLWGVIALFISESALRALFS